MLEPYTSPATWPIVSSPEPALKRGKGSGDIFERFLGCAESVVLDLGKPIKLQYSTLRETCV